MFCDLPRVLWPLMSPSSHGSLSLLSQRFRLTRLSWVSFSRGIVTLGALLRSTIQTFTFCFSTFPSPTVSPPIQIVTGFFFGRLSKWLEAPPQLIPLPVF